MLDKVLTNGLALLKFLREYPMAIYICLTIVFGGLIIWQQITIQALHMEVGALRGETQKIHEIVLLKQKLWEANCTH